MPKSEKEDSLITIRDFDKFWEDWPSKRRGSKGKALTSWMKLCSSNNPHRPEWQRVRAAVKRQKKSDQWQEEKYIPHAVSWLNNKRWLDDPKALKRYKFDKDDNNTPLEDLPETNLGHYYPDREPEDRDE